VIADVTTGTVSVIGVLPEPALEETIRMAAAIDVPDDARLAGESAVAAVVIDSDGRLVEATCGAATLLGYERDDLRGRALQDLAAEGWSWVVQNAMLRLSSGSSDPFDLLLRGRSGRRTLVQMIPRPMLNPLGGGSEPQFLIVWLEQRMTIEPAPLTAAEAEVHRLAYGLLKTHDAERGRVASELHDGVAPLLIMAKFMVEDALARLARGAQREATGLLVNTVARLREVLADVRRISTELRPSSLDDLGLLPTIQWHCRNVADAYRDLRVTAELKVDEMLVPEALKVEIFRIVQEALNNVGRHARATEARVSLELVEGRLRLRVEDNGVGFDVDQALRADACGMGLGLHSIRKRIDATRGDMLLSSSRFNGTLIGASWPLRAPAA
jgi:two-component system NarL family sensor kinase